MVSDANKIQATEEPKSDKPSAKIVPTFGKKSKNIKTSNPKKFVPPIKYPIIILKMITLLIQTQIY